jgi:trimethylamine--corrinoid protein Co-methyltransferase
MEGGAYRPLDRADQERIHDAALTVLEEIGLADAIPSCVEACTAVGATMGEDGRLRFPRRVVEAAIAGAARGFPLHARNPARSLQPGGSRVHFGTAGAAVHLVDPLARTYRDSVALDLYDAARLVDTLDNIHFFQRTLVPRDMETPLEMDVNTLYACLAGTDKHVGTSFVTADNAQLCVELMYEVAGGEAAFRERPFVSNSNCFVVPPLKFAEDACRVVETCVRAGVPVLLLSAGQAGATAPGTLAGAVVQAVAEVLAGLVYVNALSPGHPAIFGTWPFVSDLRTGAMSGGSGEQALLTAACGQMAQFYDLPGGSAAGMADAKLPDVQAGYEKGISNVMAGLSGLNLVYEAAGMHGSLLGFCLESLVIDNDLLGQALRCVRGIEVTDETLALDAIRQVCTEGPGHYLGHSQTLAVMQTEYVYPQIGDRTSPKEWAELGRPDLVESAHRRVRQVLASHYPAHIDPGIDAGLRDRYPIRIPATEMTADSRRWQ